MAEARSFDAFYGETCRRQLLNAYATTGNIADAQDCVQEAYTRAWQHWGRVSRYEDPEAWVRTVAWRLAANRWRNLAAATRALVRSGPPTSEPEPSPDTVALVTALRRIAPAQRRAIVLHHLCGLTVEQVALETAVPVGTVKTRLARGRAALAPLLESTSSVAEVRHV